MFSPRPRQEKYSAPRGGGDRARSSQGYAPGRRARARIALAEQDLAAALRQVADRDQLAARVDPDQVAHEVIAAAAASACPEPATLKPDVDEVRGALEVAGEHVADILAEHVERRPAVERDEHVRVALGDAMSQHGAGRCGVQRRAALRQPRRHAHVAAQHRRRRDRRRSRPARPER
jgi:hypothetical protein